VDTLADFKQGFITSTDQTKIGYRQIGVGPAVILVHGGLQSSLNFTRLAKALADDFTVYIPDRRGRGLSGAYGDNDDLKTEANDILALVRHTNAQNIFGLSSGAIITLQTALMEPALKKVALYEPPIPVNGNTFKKLDVAYEDAMSKGNLGKAFVAILKGTGDASIFRTLPAFITAPLVNKMMKAQMAKGDQNRTPLQELVPTFHYDGTIVNQSAPLIDKAKSLDADVLLLGGAKSQQFLKQALDQLSLSLPNAKRVVFDNQGHLAADNTGGPEKVADELVKFFKSI
jgi:pimeloyl-ACP methyl ester carboxylesterase